MKKIVITGSAGEVGFNLLMLMSSEYGKKYSKYSFVCIDKNNNNLLLQKELFPFIKAVHADLAKKGSWEREFKDAYAVIQLQAQISSPLEKAYYKNNVDSVKNVVLACEKHKIKRLIHASSSQVVSVANDHYTKSKKLGDAVVAKTKVPYIVLRPTLLHGLFDIKHLGYLTKIIDISPVFPMPGSGKYLRQPLFVEDFCRIIISCLDKKMDRKTYLIAGKEKIDMIDLLRIIAKEKKKKVVFLKIPIPVFKSLIKIYGLINRSTRIVPDQLDALTAGDIFAVETWEKTFNVRPTSFRDGTARMVSSKYYPLSKRMKSQIL